MGEIVKVVDGKILARRLEMQGCQQFPSPVLRINPPVCLGDVFRYEKSHALLHLGWGLQK